MSYFNCSNSKSSVLLLGQWIHVGMDEMYEIVHQTTYRFFGIDEMYKLVMDEMYEIV